MKTDPRTKIICLLLFIVCLFVSNSYVTLAFDFGILVIIYLTNSVSFAKALKTLGKTILLVAICSILNGLANSVKDGIFLFSRLCLAVIASSYVTQTTSMKQISDALEKLLHSRDLAMTISIALHFVPILADEAIRIKEAQQIRGAKAKSLTPLIVPMFQNAFRRAGALGEAMEARGYDIECKKTKMKVLKYSVKDFAIYAFSIALLLALIYLRRFDFGL